MQRLQAEAIPAANRRQDAGPLEPAGAGLQVSQAEAIGGGVPQLEDEVGRRQEDERFDEGEAVLGPDGLLAEQELLELLGLQIGRQQRIGGGDESAFGVPGPDAGDTWRAARAAARTRATTGGPPPVEFSGDRYEFAVLVLAEVYVSRILDRDEFRRHCDHHRTRDAILANLDFSRNSGKVPPRGLEPLS